MGMHYFIVPFPDEIEWNRDNVASCIFQYRGDFFIRELNPRGYDELTLCSQIGNFATLHFLFAKEVHTSG